MRKLYTGFLALSFLLALVLAAGPAATADYPSKPVNLTVSYKAGGSTDVAARAMVPYLEKYLKTTVVVKNLPGAGGQIGWTKLSMAKPDGYTIGFINMPAINLVYAAREGVAYDPVKSFDPIGCNIIDPNTLLVRKEDDRFKNIQDLIEAARKSPGKVVCGMDGPLSDDSLALIKMSKILGIKFGIVNYNGSAPAHAALLGKHTDFIVSNTLDVIKYKDKERCLVQFWKERYGMNPDTPTFKELFGKEIIGSSTRAFAAPAGIPADRLQKIRDAFKQAANDPEYLARAEKIGLTLAWMDHAELGQYIKDTQKFVDSIIDMLK